MSGRKKLLAPENDFTKHTYATSIVKFTTTKNVQCALLRFVAENLSFAVLKPGT